MGSAATAVSSSMEIMTKNSNFTGCLLLLDSDFPFLYHLVHNPSFFHSCKSLLLVSVHSNNNPLLLKENFLQIFCLRIPFYFSLIYPNLTHHPINKKPRYMAGMVNFKYINQGSFTTSIKTYSL